MKVLLTSRQNITSKTGDKYQVLRGISKNGQTVEVWLNSDLISRCDVPAKYILPQDVLDEMFKGSPLVDVSFNQLGRVESIEAL